MTAVVLSIEERVHVPATALDHEGFRAWFTSDEFPEGLRATFVSGEVLLDMSPEEIEGHNKVKSALVHGLKGIVDDEDLGEIFSDGVAVSHPGAALSCEPDLTFVSWEAFDRGRVRLVKKAGKTDRYVELEGAPDLVVEVVSDSSVRKDLRLLRGAYARAGIPEYWLVDARGEGIRFEILHLAAGAYESSAPEGKPQRSAVLGRSFTLSRTKNRAGRFRYRLDVS